MKYWSFQTSELVPRERFLCVESESEFQRIWHFRFALLLFEFPLLLQLLSEFYAASFPLTCTSCVPSCAFLFFSLSLWGLFVHSILLYAHALPSLLSLLAISHFPFPLSFFLSFCQLVAFAIPVLHIADAGFVFILHGRQIYRNKRHTHRLSVPILLDSR